MNRNKISNIIKIIVALGVLVFIIYFVKPSEIYQTYLKSNKIFLFLAILLLPLNIYFQYVKWYILSVKFFDDITPKKSWMSLFFGISGGIFTPMKTGEYITRAIPYENAKFLDVALITLIDKFIPTIIITLIGGISFIFYFWLKGFYSISTSVIFILVYIFLFYSILRLLFLYNKLNRGILNFFNKYKLTSNIIERISFIKKIDRKTLTAVIVYSFFYHLTFTVQMALLISAFSNELRITLFLLLANIIIFTQIIIPPIALGEVGIREGASIYFLHSFGYNAAIGFNAAFSLFIINLLIPSIIGLIMLLKFKKDKA